MSIIHAFVNASTGVILIRLDMKAVRYREADVGSNRRERRFKLRGGVVSLDFVNTVGSRLPTPPASTSAPMRTCLTGPDRLVCFLLRRRRVSLGRRCWTQRGRGRHSRGRLPCEKLYTE